MTEVRVVRPVQPSQCNSTLKERIHKVGFRQFCQARREDKAKTRPVSPLLLKGKGEGAMSARTVRPTERADSSGGREEPYRAELGVTRLVRGVNGPLKRVFGAMRRAKIRQKTAYCDLSQFQCAACRETGLSLLSGSATDPKFLQQLTCLLPNLKSVPPPNPCKSPSLPRSTPPISQLNLSAKTEASRSRRLNSGPRRDTSLHRLSVLFRSKLQHAFDLILLSRAVRRAADQSLTFDFSAESSPA